MGFNPIFYAGRPKLSEVTIDSDLNMGGRNISGVDTLRAGRVYSPYTTEPWETEELDWGDDSETGEVPIVTSEFAGTTTETVLKSFTTPASETFKLWQFKYIVYGVYNPQTLVLRIKHGSTILDEVSPSPGGGQTETVVRRVALPPQETISITAQCPSGGSSRKLMPGSTYKYTGLTWGQVMFDLTGKWLALGIDMHGIAATVKIQGVEIPYTDYAKYFPIAPTELKFPSDWSDSQIRPVVKVYK